VKRALLILAVLLVPALAQAAPKGIPLWEDAYTGMSVKEILHYFPDAQRVSPKDQRPHRPEQGTELARIPRVQIAADPYRARFYFGKAGLKRVVLELIRQGDMTFSEGLKRTQKVRDALSRKYGQPVKKTASSKGYLVDWKNGKTGIHLVVITKSYEVKQFEIVYEEAGEE